MESLLRHLVSLISDNVGLSPAVSRFLLAYCASIPLSLVFRVLPVGSSPASLVRHLYAALSGLALSWLAFGVSSIPLMLIPVAVAGVAMLVAPRNSGTITFFVTFAFLIGCHVWLMSGHAWREGGIDCTGALMILTLKATSIATDCHDGVQERSRQKKDHKGVSNENEPQAETPGSSSAANGVLPPGDNQERIMCAPPQGQGSCFELSSGQPAAGPEKSTGAREYALHSVPNLWKLLGYCFCCGLHFAGPFFFYRDYCHWIDGTHEYKWEGDQKAKRPPFVQRLLRALAQACLAAVVYLWLDSSLDTSVILHPPTYFALPLWRRALLLYQAGTATRWKYYFIWSISEAAMIASGLGFSGWREEKRSKGEGKEEASWERAENCHILGVELASSAALFAVNWNISVGRWLRTYVYERLVPPGRKPQFIHLLATQLVAGVWHGLYPGYILFFSGIAWEVGGSRVLFKWEKKIPERLTAVRLSAKVAHTLFAAFCNNFFAIGFIVLTAQDTFTAWAGLYYAGVILPGLAFALDMVLPKERTRKQKAT